MNIDRFKNDHNVIMKNVSELRSLVKSGIPQNASQIAAKLVQMSAKINLHLAAEDASIYPTLAKSSDPHTARKALSFQREMGDIAHAYGDFSRRWNTGGVIAADPDGFREHANGVFKALHERIQRENSELYPLAESE